MDELRECPFCGGDTVGTDGASGYYWEVCSDCASRGPLRFGAGKDESDWNTRASDDVILGLVEALKFAKYAASMRAIPDEEWEGEAEQALAQARKHLQSEK